MFNKYRNKMWRRYNQGKEYFENDFRRLLNAESYAMKIIGEFLDNNMKDIATDYNEASYLYPFWKNYPPEDRGRQPVGDQFPWIEVGEQVLPPKLNRYLSGKFKIRDCGLPAGPDQRIIISGHKLKEILQITDSVWLFIDIKSVGPRDDAPHAVMSHNQISVNGVWINAPGGVHNDRLIALGSRAQHDFWPALPPLYVLSDGTIVPVIHIILKPVYSMLVINNNNDKGQPLERITAACIPNGLLLTINPGYLNQFPNLLFPGKDDKGTNPRKLRARISFEILEKIHSWRIATHISPI